MVVRIGVEFHKKVSYQKLFCKCKHEPKEVQPKIFYVSYKDSTIRKFLNPGYCRVETEEDPPWLNLKVFKKALACIVGLPKVQILDRIVFSRKQILDGSLTSGYQRTALVARGGVIELSTGKQVEIDKVYIEEDSCSKKDTLYCVDRQGCPLVEVATKHEELSSVEVIDLLKKIDEYLNWGYNTSNESSCKRQDINISVDNKGISEYKGVDKLSYIAEIIELEKKENLNVKEPGFKNTYYYYKDKENNPKRTYLRSTLGSKRMSYESEIGVIDLVLLKKTFLAQNLKFMTKKRQFEAKIPANRLGTIQKLYKNKKYLKTLIKYDTIFKLQKFDFGVLDHLRPKKLTTFKQYLLEIASFEGLKKGLTIKPYSKEALLKNQASKTFYKDHKLYLPRSFYLQKL